MPLNRKQEKGRKSARPARQESRIPGKTSYDSEELEDTMMGPAVNNEDMYKRDNDHTDAGIMEDRRGPF
ncbi:hypothetical protein CR205_05250 [Alteribacter lacisalsi]|uniref:Uncharacterized protein n=1 Tax=Alteribacter lacisalsi TaxID=2045244 RepID=A0A2W0H802_9BACI|nr:hypothetical protein [Alteribacter lacisalsi]PYZ98003.1 hypothetical protein CR205_05250 [Alteribacter lacisalsi]